jgi:hypothetical protein
LCLTSKARSAAVRTGSLSGVQVEDVFTAVVDEEADAEG